MVVCAFCRSGLARVSCFVMQLGIHLLCDYFCASFHWKWPFTRYIFWWPFAMLWRFSILIRACMWNVALIFETICCMRYTTFEQSGREDVFVFGPLHQSLTFLLFTFCGLLFNVTVNALSRFFVLIINPIPFYSIFFNSLETKWGMVNSEERPFQRTCTQSASRHPYVP